MVAAAVAALFPARSAQRGPGCASRAAALRPRPEPDPGECGPATPARPGPGPGAGIGPHGASPPWAPGAAGRGHSTPSFVCSRLQGPLPCRPSPTGRPSGPRVPSPAGGARTEDGAEENSRTSGLPPFLQGEGQVGLGVPRAGPLDLEPAPSSRGSCQPHPLPGAAPAWYSLRGEVILGQSPVSSTLGPVGSFFQELPSLWGLYPCVPMKTPARHVLV